MITGNACPKDVAYAVYRALESGAKLPPLESSEELREALLTFRPRTYHLASEQTDVVNGNGGLRESHDEAQSTPGKPKSPKVDQEGETSSEEAGSDSGKSPPFSMLMLEALLRRRLDAVQRLYEVCPQLLGSIPLFDQHDRASHPARSSTSQGPCAYSTTSFASATAAVLLKSNYCPFQRSSQLLDLAAENKALLSFVLQHHPDVDMWQRERDDINRDENGSVSGSRTPSRPGLNMAGTSGSTRHDSSVSAKSHDTENTDREMDYPGGFEEKQDTEDSIDSEESNALADLDPSNPITICILKKNHEVLHYLLFKHVWQHFLLDEMYKMPQNTNGLGPRRDEMPPTCPQCEWFLPCAAVIGYSYLLDLVLYGKFCDHSYQDSLRKSRSPVGFDAQTSLDGDGNRETKADDGYGIDSPRENEATVSTDENTGPILDQKGTNEEKHKEYSLKKQTAPCCSCDKAASHATAASTNQPATSAEMAISSTINRESGVEVNQTSNEIVTSSAMDTPDNENSEDRMTDSDNARTASESEIIASVPSDPCDTVVVLDSTMSQKSTASQAFGPNQTDQSPAAVSSQPENKESLLAEKLSLVSLGSPVKTIPRETTFASQLSKSMPSVRPASDSVSERKIILTTGSEASICKPPQIVSSSQKPETVTNCESKATPSLSTANPQVPANSSGAEGKEPQQPDCSQPETVQGSASRSDPQECAEPSTARTSRSQEFVGQSLAYRVPDPNMKLAVSLPVMDRWISRCMHVRLCPLHLACWRCDPTSIRVLLRHGADVNLAAEELEYQKEKKDDDNKMESTSSSHVPSTPSSAASLDIPLNFVSVTLNTNFDLSSAHNSMEEMLKRTSKQSKGHGLTPLAMLALGIRSPPDFSLSIGKSLGLVLPTLPEAWGGQVDRSSQQAKLCLMEALQLLLDAGSDVNSSSIVFGKTFRVMELFLQPSVDLYYAPLMPRGGRDSAVLRCMDLERVAEIVLTVCWELASRGGRLGPEIATSMEWNLFRMDWMFLQNDTLQGRFLHLGVFLGLFPPLDPTVLFSHTIFLQHGGIYTFCNNESDCEVCQSKGIADLNKAYYPPQSPPPRPSCVPWAPSTSRTSTRTHSDTSANGSDEEVARGPLVDDQQQTEAAEIESTYYSTVGTQVSLSHTEAPVLPMDPANTHQTSHFSRVGSESSSSFGSNSLHSRASPASSKTKLIRNKLHRLASDIAALNSSHGSVPGPAVSMAQKMLWAVEERQRTCLEKFANDVVRLSVPQSSLVLIFRFLCLPDIHLLVRITKYMQRTSTATTETTLQRLSEALHQAQFRSLRHTCKLVILMTAEWRCSVVLRLPLPNSLKQYLLDSNC